MSSLYFTYQELEFPNLFQGHKHARCILPIRNWNNVPSA